MSWTSIQADLQDVLDTVRTGKTLVRALEECGHSRSQAVFACLVCGTKGAISVKHFLDRHFAGETPSMPNRCIDRDCEGSLTYHGIE